MFLVVTRSFPPDVGGMQVLMGGLSENLLNHGPVKVFAYECLNSNIYDTKSLINIERDLAVAEDKLTEVATRLSAAEATWEMAENLYRQLADQVREHAYDIKDLSR